MAPSTGATFFMSNYYEGEHIRGLNQASKALEKGDYEECVFENCNFSEQHLSGYNFMECQFHNCDFSNAHIGGIGLKDVKFEGCKLMGVNFTEAAQFMIKLSFKDCNLKYTNFFKMQIAETVFEACELEESQMSEADLTGALFLQSDLRNVQFDRAILNQADLRSAINFSIDPNKNQLKKARFSNDNLAGLLTAYPILIEN